MKRVDRAKPAASVSALASDRAVSLPVALMLPLLRLQQVISPASPTGAFSYSQGLEWAVEAQWISDAEGFKQWLYEQLSGTLAKQDLPLLIRCYRAWQSNDFAAANRWSQTAIAFRETAELRDEERRRGAALWKLAAALTPQFYNDNAEPVLNDKSQIAAFARYCQLEQISESLTLYGYAFSWLDNQIVAGIKLIPLGQTAGQQILYQLAAEITACIGIAQKLPDERLGFSSPALAFASSAHETQYCRLYRS